MADESDRMIMGTDTASDQDPGAASGDEPAAGGPGLPVSEGLGIKADGTWTYEGTAIRRLPLVRLFASVLRREGDRFWLVTPVERVEILVEDAPFVAVELEASGAGDARQLRLRTNLDQWVEVGEAHPLRVRPPAHPDVGDAELVPYVLVRDGLEARLLRAVYYELVELGGEAAVDGRPRFGVWSRGRFFPLDAAST